MVYLELYDSQSSIERKVVLKAEHVIMFRPWGKLGFLVKFVLSRVHFSQFSLVSNYSWKLVMKAINYHDFFYLESGISRSLEIKVGHSVKSPLILSHTPSCQCNDPAASL